MNLWLAFLGGVIIGWVIEWVIDWYYWRRGVAEFYAVETALRRRVEAAEAESAAARQAEEKLRTELALARDEIAALRTSLGVQQPPEGADPSLATPAQTINSPASQSTVQSAPQSPTQPDEAAQPAPNRSDSQAST